MTGKNILRESDLDRLEELAERQAALPDDLMSESELIEAEARAERQADLPDQDDS